jgi:hypothetical protein
VPRIIGEAVNRFSDTDGRRLQGSGRWPLRRRLPVSWVLRNLLDVRCSLSLCGNSVTPCSAHVFKQIEGVAFKLPALGADRSPP